jgi:O-antigen ligase
LNAVLFIRPAEIVPDLLDLPIYEVLILSCVVVSLPAILERVRLSSLAAQPISACVFWLLGAVLLSHLCHFQFGLAHQAGVEFFKVVVYYVLFISLVTSFARLRCFLFWLVVFIIVLALLALLQWHEIINIQALEAINQRHIDQATGDIILVQRLCSTGIYHDPNDLSQILVVGMGISLYWLFNRATGSLRLAWLAPLALFGYDLALTRSRGGFLAFLAGLLVFLGSRFGWKRMIPLAMIFLPVILFLFAGRQTNIDLSDQDDTGLSRILLWREGLELLKESPLFGIGKGEYVDRALLVAHNSFVHCYTELGVFGGTFFTGVFILAAWSLHRAKAVQLRSLNPEVQRLRPYLLGMVAAYVAGMFSLSRAYIAPTYLIPALAVAYAGLPEIARRLPPLRFDLRLLWRLALLSVLILTAFHVFVQIFATGA